jgi:hypothetical protein
MYKISIIFLSFVLYLTACQTTDTNPVTLDEVLHSFEEQQLSLKEMSSSSKNIFGMKLNGVKPNSYELNGKKLFIYIYKSSKKREKGLEDFMKKTETANVVSYNYYEFKNVMFFYVHSLDLSEEVPFDKEIQKIVDDLNT